MSNSATIDLQKLGRDAAMHVADVGKVELVDVVPGDDYMDRPVYRFAFLIDESVDWKSSGLVRIHLDQKLRDELVALGDAHYPVIQILSRAELSQRTGA